MNCATFRQLFIFILFFNVVVCNLPVPRPVITMHSGHIGLYDRLLETQFSGVIQTGEPYTLDIYMGNTDEYDYVIENCVFNSRLNFMDNYGCLRKTAFFVEKWETEQYNRPGSVKRTLIHLLADQPILNFECQVKVIHCSGCAEQSCERRPVYNTYPTWVMPLNCCNYPQPPYYPMPPPIQPPQPGPFPSQQGSGWWSDAYFWGIPWYLWLVFLLLLLLLLCCLCALIAFCFTRGKRKRRDSQYSRRSFTPPPPAPSHNRVYTIDGAVQTLPESRQVSQQVDMHESYSRSNYAHPPQKERAYNLRQLDSHASIDLHPETSGGRRSAAYTNQVYDGDFYEEDGHEKVFTKYENYNTPRHESSTPVAHSIPILRTSSSYNTSQEERRLQKELEEHLRHRSNYQDRSEEFEERIEEQLRSQHYQRHLTEPEAFREETVRSMRQSSVI